MTCYLKNIRSLIFTNRFHNTGEKIFYSSSSSKKYDIIVVGGGIIGIATARDLAKVHSNLKIAVVEKENEVAYHQSGHNSGVIHAGIYYQPGSLKAKLCVQGLQMAYDYLNKNNIPYKKCGKLIVARNDNEVGRLEELLKRGEQNNVPDLKILNKEEMKKIEPFCQGKSAIHSPHTGIVDWKLVTKHFANDFTDNGGDIYLNFNVENLLEKNESEEGTENLYPVQVISNTNKVLETKYVLTCGGLYSDSLSMLSGGSRDPQIIPFRGEYLLLDSNKTSLINGNIYPVPDARFPFLGVHFTPRTDGSVWIGPNAILSFKKEGYKWSDIDVKELKQTLLYPGFRKMAVKYLGFGSKEMLKSVFTRLQLREIQSFIPTIELRDLARGPAGVRAQALDLNGNMVDDFVFQVGKRILHCRNAPSPGATSSLAIAQFITQKFTTSYLT